MIRNIYNAWYALIGRAMVINCKVSAGPDNRLILVRKKEGCAQVSNVEFFGQTFSIFGNEYTCNPEVTGDLIGELK